jgi:glycosyltransferase involved in cell wall biosynthesis
MRKPVRRVGFIWGYLDLQADAAHMQKGVTRGLEQLGVEIELLDATPVRIGRPVYRLLTAVGKAGNGYQLRPEMLAVARLSGTLLRRRRRPGVEGWIHFAAPPLGRPAPGPYVTFEDITVAQRQRSGVWFGLSERRWARWHASQASLYRHAHACCTVSNWSKASLVSDYGVPEEKIHVVGLGRNVDLEPPEARDWSKPRFLFVGRDWRRKNGEVVLRVFARLHQSVPSARLDLVGDHPSVDMPGVEGHGYLSFQDRNSASRLRELYRRATCFVMPSLNEPWGIVYLEAASAGLPVIATANGGIRDALGDDGALYVDPLDEQDIHQAMLRLADPSFAASTGAAAQRHACPYTWDHVARGVLRALNGSSERDP